MKKPNTFKQKNRQLLSSISLFLLGREELKNFFWNIASVDYDMKNQKIKIGITALDGKLGQTLEKLRKTCKPLSAHLYEIDQTFKKAHIHFFVFKDKKYDEAAAGVERVKSIIDQINGVNIGGEKSKN